MIVVVTVAIKIADIQKYNSYDDEMVTNNDDTL